MRQTWIGAHCLPGPDGVGLLLDAGIPFIVSVDNVGLIEESKRKRPEITAVMRFFVPNITAEQGRNSDPVAFADWYVNKSEMSEKIKHPYNIAVLRMPGVYLQGTNEPVYKIGEGANTRDDVDGLKWFAAFESERLRLLADVGILGAAGNFSTGYPSIESWMPYLDPMLEAIKRHAGLLCIHGYSHPGEMARDDHNTNRHEIIWRDVLEPNGYGDMPMGYTEWGRIDQQTQGPDDAEYLEEMKRADSRFRQFKGNLKGVAWYTLGGGGNKDWEKYNLKLSLVEKWAEYTRNTLAQPDTTLPVPPVDVPPASTRFVRGDTFRVIADPRMRGRATPAGDFVAWVSRGHVGVIQDGPISKQLGTQTLVWWKATDGLWFAESQGGVDYLEKVVIPVPPSTGVNLIANGDYTLGFTTPFMDTRFTPPRTRDNVRVPIGHWLRFLDDVIDPRLERQDPFAPWLAPESVLRSGDTVKYPFTERLPDNELTLYLNSISPVAMHYFKLYGIVWLEQGVMLDAPAGRYEYSIESYCDTHVRDHRFITNEAIASEWRLNVSGRPVAEWDNGATLPLGQDERKFFGHWRTSTVTFDHIGGPLSVSFEFRCRWGIEHVGVFLRNERLIRLS